MAYLDNTVITVDAVLTKKGRERLGQGRAQFNITKFAVSDDEIDYSLYAPAHALGSEFYSNIIESMPVLEAIPDESQTMRYKLVTMQDNDGIKRLPIIRGVGLENASMTLNFDESAQARPIKPETIAYKIGGGISGAQFDATAGYTLILFDEEAATVSVEGKVAQSRDITDFNKNVNFSTTTVAVGKSFFIKPKRVATQRTTKFTVFGNESGVTKTISLTINPQT